MAKDMAKENILTSMEMSMWASSRPIRKMESEDSPTLIKANITDNGSMVKNKVKECTFTQTRMYFQEIGMIIKSMATELMFFQQQV